MFWNLWQQMQLYKQGGQTYVLEKRVEHLEKQLTRTREVLGALLYELELRFGEDLDGDGQIGDPKKTTDGMTIKELQRIAQQKHEAMRHSGGR